MTDETKHKLWAQLASEIEFKIQLLERRAAIHAQTMYPIKDLELKSPDLGVIPKLIEVSNSNQESERVIEQCNMNKKRLLLIKKHLHIDEPWKILKCLSNNRYVKMTITELEDFLEVMPTKKKHQQVFSYLFGFVRYGI